MDEMEWGWVCVFAVIGAMALFLFIGLVAGMHANSVASDCDKTGRVVLNEVAYTCERLDRNATHDR